MKKPVVLVVMDGVGETPEELGNMVKKATTRPSTNSRKPARGRSSRLTVRPSVCPRMTIWATPRSATTRSAAARSTPRAPSSSANPSSPARIYTSRRPGRTSIANAKDNGKALHFLGLLSDGNVHSNISHLIAMLQEAKAEGVKRVYCHILLDGRDVPATSALEYVRPCWRTYLPSSAMTAGFDYARSPPAAAAWQITMDRYEANWPMVEKGWRHARSRRGPSVRLRQGGHRDLPRGDRLHRPRPAAFRDRKGRQAGRRRSQDGDSVVLFNFRGDRAQEISMAFDSDRSFDKFDRGELPEGEVRRYAPV